MTAISSLVYKDLRGYLDAVDKLGELRVVNGADWDLEIGAITEVAARAANPKVFCSIHQGLSERISRRDQPGLFGADDGVGIRSRSEARRPRSHSRVEGKTRQPDADFTVEVASGPITENVDGGDKVDLLKFPTPRWHEHDGGRYIGTGCMVIMEDPDGKWTNVGTYRVCVHDKNTLGIWISPGKHGRLIREKYWAQGKPCPVVISFGQDPILAKVASWYEAWGVSELEIAGWLFGEPVKVIRGQETGLPIPATSELAVEGFIVPPNEDSRSEGPFGEWTGYYASGTRNEPVVKVKSVVYRNDPIIFGMPPGISGKSVRSAPPTSGWRWRKPA